MLDKTCCQNEGEHVSLVHGASDNAPSKGPITWIGAHVWQRFLKPEKRWKTLSMALAILLVVETLTSFYKLGTSPFYSRSLDASGYICAPNVCDIP